MSRQMLYLMDSGTCAKQFENPGLHTDELGRRNDLFQGGNSGFLQVMAKAFFKGENNSKFFHLQT